jgi:4'-phosphopantetheinyl transferase
MTTSENHPTHWPAAPARPQLAPGCVHLFLVNLDELPVEKSGPLAPAEQRRMERFHFAKDRRRFAASRQALRDILAGYLNRPSNELTFQTGAFGKPALLDPEQGLHFNLSHSDNFLLLAISADSELGVDLEMIREDMEMEPLAEHYFSPEQQWEFRTARGSERVWKFFELWTATEARLKASGNGLGSNLKETDERWTIKRLRIADRFAAAVAVGNPETQLECWTWLK